MQGAHRPWIGVCATREEGEISPKSEYHALKLLRNSNMEGTEFAPNMTYHTSTHERNPMRNRMAKKKFNKGPNQGSSNSGSTRCGISTLVWLACAILASSHGNGLEAYGRQPGQEVIHKMHLGPPGLSNPCLPSYASNTYKAGVRSELTKHTPAKSERIKLSMA